MRAPFVPLLTFALVTLTAIIVLTSGDTRSSTAIPPAAASPTTIAAAASPTSTVSLAPTGGAIPEIVTQVVVAVTSREPDQLKGFIAYQQVGCTKALGGGGPPKCKPADAEGTVYKVFAAGRCEPEWVGDAGPTIAQIVASAGPLYAAATIAPTGPAPDPNWPKGESVVLFRGSGTGVPVSYFILSADQIVRAHLVCDAGAGREEAEIRRLGGTSYLVAPAVQ